MPMTTDRSKSKPEVEFQYGYRSFSENGSSYTSAVDWDIFTKFGTAIDTDLLRTRAVSNRNRKLIRDVNGCHRENFNDVITTPPADCSRRWSDSHEIWYADPKWDPITTGRLKSKLEVEFQYGGRSFSETESCYNSPVEWDIFTKFGTVIDTDLPRTCALPT